MGGVTIPGMRFSSKEKAMAYLKQRKEFYKAMGLVFASSTLQEVKPTGYVRLYARWTK
jgi:hypothetical protein